MGEPGGDYRLKEPAEEKNLRVFVTPLGSISDIELFQQRASETAKRRFEYLTRRKSCTLCAPTMDPTHVEDEESTASLTRRDLFQRLGWVIALAQLPSPTEASPQGTDRQTPAASDDHTRSVR